MQTAHCYISHWRNISSGKAMFGLRFCGPQDCLCWHFMSRLFYLWRMGLSLFIQHGWILCPVSRFLHNLSALLSQRRRGLLDWRINHDGFASLLYRSAQWPTPILSWCLWTQKVEGNRAKSGSLEVYGYGWIWIWSVNVVFLCSRFTPSLVLRQGSEEVPVPAEPASGLQPAERGTGTRVRCQPQADLDCQRWSQVETLVSFSEVESKGTTLLNGFVEQTISPAPLIPKIECNFSCYLFLKWTPVFIQYISDWVSSETCKTTGSWCVGETAQWAGSWMRSVRLNTVYI